MKWQKRSAGKLHFLTKTLGKMPKKVKNGYFWSFCDPHGQPLHPTVQDLVQIVRPTTIFNNSEAKMLSFSFFFHYFLAIFMGFFQNPHFWPFYPLGDPPWVTPWPYHDQCSPPCWLCPIRATNQYREAAEWYF